MNKVSNILSKILDILKKILVRFRKAGFGIYFIRDLFLLPDFITDKECSIFSKLKVILTFLITVCYFASSVDLIPEFLLGGFGFLDDILVLIWAIGLIDEQLSAYRIMVDNRPESKIIDNVNWKIEDED